MKMPDYYEFLQISANAETATIYRVYRYLAARHHPDNPETGDAEKFMLVKQAFDVLSDPKRRAEYDAAYKKEAPPPVPLSTSIDFMDTIDGEMNRRLAVLGLLYIQRRTNPYKPEVSLAEVEIRMGFPRDYLHFTTWYLSNKKYITQADNSDFTLTALGVDFVESNRANIPVLNRLLTSGTGASTKDGVAAGEALTPTRTPIIVPAGNGVTQGNGINGDDGDDEERWHPGRSRTSRPS
jgi:curved DNA-binding protein CbpA